MKKKTMKNKKNIQGLIPAKKAFEIIEQTSQLERAIQDINCSIHINKTSAYICDNEKLQKETINALLAAGYDLKICYFDTCLYDRGYWSNLCCFDNKCSGKIYYNNEYTKIKLGYEKNDNKD